jgi:hypothetical protein
MSIYKKYDIPLWSKTVALSKFRSVGEENSESVLIKKQKWELNREI